MTRNVTVLDRLEAVSSNVLSPIKTSIYTRWSGIIKTEH